MGKGDAQSGIIRVLLNGPQAEKERTQSFNNSTESLGWGTTDGNGVRLSYAMMDTCPDPIIAECSRPVVVVVVLVE